MGASTHPRAAAVTPHGCEPRPRHAVSLAERLRADEPVHDLRAVSNSDSWGLTMGTMHTEAGVLGVSVARRRSSNT